MESGGSLVCWMSFVRAKGGRRAGRGDHGRKFGGRWTCFGDLFENREKRGGREGRRSGRRRDHVGAEDVVV